MTTTRTAPALLFALACTATALFAGCATVGQGPGVSYRNHADLEASYAGPSQPVPRAAHGIPTDKPTFVGVAISGGGSRAANFGMAALAELDELGLLRHVDAISAVSGGSLPAAFFALYGSEPDWKARGRAAIGRDFLGDFLGKLFSPKNLILNTFTDQDRSDLLAEALDEGLFGGNRPTFARLGPAGLMRPALYVNATDTTTRGERFVFTDDAFHSKLGSSLASYPLAWALAASGAFPGIFNSVTLRRYSLDPEKRREEDRVGATRHYIHLLDGGTSDNLGSDTLVELARRHHVARLVKGQTSACLLVLVDSHVPQTAASDAARSDRRNRLSVFVDLNFVDAIDAMFTHRRFYALSSLGIRKDMAQGRFDIDIDKDLIEYDVRPYLRTHSAQIGYFEREGRALDYADIAGLPDSFDLTRIPPPDAKGFACLVWHIALEDIHAIVPWVTAPGSGAGAEAPRRPLSPLEESGRAVYSYRALLARVVEQLATNYRLSGVDGCPAEFLQQALFDAGHIAVREDKVSLDKVCGWMHENKLDPEGLCRPTGTALVRSPFAVVPVEPPLDRTEIAQGVNRSMRCPR